MSPSVPTIMTHLDSLDTESDGEKLERYRTGAVVLKIAMSDEVNERTAMFKLAAHRKNAPDQD
jgi:hypothetical protein